MKDLLSEMKILILLNHFEKWKLDNAIIDILQTQLSLSQIQLGGWTKGDEVPQWMRKLKLLKEKFTNVEACILFFENGLKWT